MRLYVPAPPDDYEWCLPVNEDDSDVINRLLDGTPRSKGWTPVRVALIQHDEGKDFLRSDSPWFGDNALIFRRDAVDKLGPILRAYGELLPLHCRDADLVIYNPTTVVDALDEARSSVLRFDNGDIYHVKRYVFREERLGAAPIFKVSNERLSPTFLGEEFIGAWRAAGLVGLDFKLVWKSTNRGGDPSLSLGTP